MRNALVAELERQGLVRTGAVRTALLETPRHLFCPQHSLATAYANEPQPIGWGQTISQPAVVAWMSELLDLHGTEKVLEIGTGSGYQAAVLARLARAVYSVELVRELGEVAEARLRRLGIENVRVRVGDGYAGWPEEAPFERIVLTSAPPALPGELLAQLADGGRLVAPIGPEDATQKLVVVRKSGGKWVQEAVGDVRFVPMVRPR